MAPAQKQRAYDLYRDAQRALSALAEERLNLDHETRDALNECRGKLEEFDHLRAQQPLFNEVPL